MTPPSVPAAELLAAMSAVRRTARRATHKVWTAEPLSSAPGELLHLVAARPGLSVAEAATELRLAPNAEDVSALAGAVPVLRRLAEQLALL